MVFYDFWSFKMPLTLFMPEELQQLNGKLKLLAHLHYRETLHQNTVYLEGQSSSTPTLHLTSDWGMKQLGLCRSPEQVLSLAQSPPLKKEASATAITACSQCREVPARDCNRTLINVSADFLQFWGCGLTGHMTSLFFDFRK